MSSTTYSRWLLIALAAGSSNTLGKAQNEIVSVGYTASSLPPRLPTVSPGKVVTLLSTALDVPDAVATETPLPRSLSGVSVLARVIGSDEVPGYPYPSALPIIRVHNRKLPVYNWYGGVPCPANPDSMFCSSTEITVEIPTERVCVRSFDDPRPCTTSRLAYPPLLLVLNIRANGITGPDMVLQVGQWSPHLLLSCDSIFGPPASSTCQALIIHSDGTLVSNDSPARVGETITLYATGLTYYGPPTGYPVEEPIQITAFNGEVDFTFTAETGRSPSTARFARSIIRVLQPDWVGMVPGYVGLNQVNVTVPAMPEGQYPCTQYGNALISLVLEGVGQYICIQP